MEGNDQVVSLPLFLPPSDFQWNTSLKKWRKDGDVFSVQKKVCTEKKRIVMIHSGTVVPVILHSVTLVILKMTVS